ncbi:MAG: hypothetical protein J6S09_05875 [Paludibacteraceae bacterium]|nr:hypothetical protein [Paludibacteraceae bacterium]
MKKISIIFVVAFIATSCAIGTYYPYAQNNFGAQSTVVLDKANFRVVRDVEAIVNVDNTNLSRADVANSAYGELLRKAQLTGSQVLINVVVEEVRRESGGFFRLLLGIPKRVQYVAARATIIEFLDETGNPTISQSYYPTNHYSTGGRTQYVANSDNVYVQDVQTRNHQPTELMASAEDLEKCEKVHKQIMKLASYVSSSVVLSKYENLYKRLPKTKENIQHIQNIQVVVILYINNQGVAFPQIEKQLKNASSMEEEIQIFLSYYKE